MRRSSRMLRQGAPVRTCGAMSTIGGQAQAQALVLAKTNVHEPVERMSMTDFYPSRPRAGGLPPVLHVRTTWTDQIDD